MQRLITRAPHDNLALVEAFLSMTVMAKQLSITQRIVSTQRCGDDVINLKPPCRAAKNASAVTLADSTTDSATELFSGAGHKGQHRIAVTPRAAIDNCPVVALEFLSALRANDVTLPAMRFGAAISPAVFLAAEVGKILPVAYRADSIAVFSSALVSTLVATKLRGMCLTVGAATEERLSAKLTDVLVRHDSTSPCYLTQ